MPEGLLGAGEAAARPAGGQWAGGVREWVGEMKGERYRRKRPGKRGRGGEGEGGEGEGCCMHHSVG